MNYILLIYADESEWTRKTEAEMAPIMEQHEQLERDLRKAGDYRGCGGLAPTAAATTVRFKNGKRLISDGPYAETKEQFGGYYVIEATSLDDAIEIASRIPLAARGGVEIRPVLDLRLP